MCSIYGYCDDYIEGFNAGRYDGYEDDERGASLNANSVDDYLDGCYKNGWEEAIKKRDVIVRLMKYGNEQT